MSEQSPDWHRVADLRPRLKPHIRVHRHSYRGQPWYVIQDTVSGRFHRFSGLANECIALMDGQRSAEAIFQALKPRLSQGQMIELLARLHQADALLTGAPADADELIARSDRQQKTARWQRWRTPLAIRIPLYDPDRLLNRLMPLGSLLFSKVGAFCWLLLVGGALLAVGYHWSELTEGVADRILGAENLLLIALTFPLVKALHELGHGLAVKMYGGEVHEIGVMLLAFFPIPYVEASAASGFSSKYQRMLVGAAGMLVELLIAALAMLIWMQVEPGFVRALCFNTMLIAGVSTLLFNGNPLLRFDAYYILMDYIEIPNLGSRANRYWVYLLQRYVYGVEQVTNPVTAPGEARWFAFYGLASFVYRMLVIFAIATFIATQYFVVGVLLAAWGVFGMLVLPMLKGIRYLFVGPVLTRHRGRALLATAALVCMLLTVVGVVPVPYRTTAQGVVHLPETSWIRAEHDGFVISVSAFDGQLVQVGESLLALDDPTLHTEVRLLELQLAELQLRRQAVESFDRMLAASIAQELILTQERLSEAERRSASLELVAQGVGRVAWTTSTADLPGRFVRRGEPMGYLLPEQGVVIRTLVDQEKADLISRNTHRIDVRLSEAVAQPFRAELIRETPAATFSLPSDALSVEGGGEIVTIAGEKGRIAYQSLFELELLIEGLPHPGRIGGRVYIRFDHGSEPVGFRWYRSARQALLSQFNV